VAIPTLFVAAGVVAWLREGLEAREAQMAALVMERELEARTDSLTGLLNRRALITALEQALAPGAKPHTFALFDLDGFKAFNDRYGHPAGDALLVRLGQSLLDEVRGRGHAFRLGGDEFCVLFDLVGPAADALVDRCADALADGDPDVGVSASYGTASLPAEAATASDALSVVDTRMYEAKGRRSDALRRAADSLVAMGHERRRGSRLAAALPSLLEDVGSATASESGGAPPTPRRPAR
jgi:two-component system, cell cycle response regulator